MRTTRLWKNLLHSKSKDRKAQKLKSFGSGNAKRPKQNSQNRLNQAKEKIPVFPLEFVEKNSISVQVDNFFLTVDLGYTRQGSDFNRASPKNGNKVLRTSTETYDRYG